MSNLVFPGNVQGVGWTILRTPEFNSIVQESAAKYQVRIAQSQNPIWHFVLIYEFLFGVFIDQANMTSYQPVTDIDQMLGWFLARQGRFDDFLFLDKYDNNSACGLRGGVWQALRSFPTSSVVIDIHGHAQLATAGGISGANYPAFSTVGGATTDGTITWVDQGFFPNGWPNAPVTLPVVQDAAGNYYSPIQRSVGNQFMEDVTDLVSGTLHVFQAGAPTSAYSLLGPGLAVPGASYGGLYLKWSSPPATPVTATFNFYYRMMFEEDTQDFEQWVQTLFTVGGSQAQSGSGKLKMMTSRPVPAF